MVTVNAPVEQVRGVIDAYRDAGGTGPVALQVHHAWAETDHTALELAHQQWRFSTLDGSQLSDLATPAEFDRAAAQASPADMRSSVVCSASLDAHADSLCEYVELGVEQLYLHGMGADQLAFIAAFTDGVLPQVRVCSRARTPDGQALRLRFACRASLNSAMIASKRSCASAATR